MKLIFEKKGIRLEHIDKYIYHKFTGLIENEEWREGFIAGVDYVMKKENLSWINDLSDFWGTDCSNIIWLHDNVNTKVSHIKKIAFVPPKKEFKEAIRNMEFYIEYSNIQLKNNSTYIAKFNTLEEAKKWVGYCDLRSSVNSSFNNNSHSGGINNDCGSS